MADLQQQGIIDTASELFQKFGLKKTTMEEIASGAGMGKSSLYYYFKSKEDVYKSVLLNEFEHFKDLITSELLMYGSPKQSISVYIKLVYSHIFNFPNLKAILLKTDPSSLDEPSLNMIQVFEAWELTVIQEMLHRGVTCSDFREMNDEEISINSQAIAIAMFGLKSVLINETDTQAFEAKIDSLIDLLLHGIGNN